MTKEYEIVYDTENYCDGYIFRGSLENALYEALNILKGWIEDEMSNWEFENEIPKPTSKQIEDWNYMIDSCEAYVVDLDYQGDNPEMIKADDYYWIDGHYYPAIKRAEDIGWKYWKE